MNTMSEQSPMNGPWMPDDGNVDYGKSHFEDDPLFVEPCRHPEHNPPTHLLVPQGKIYVHVCPGCGRTYRLRSPRYFL